MRRLWSQKVSLVISILTHACSKKFQGSYDGMCSFFNSTQASLYGGVGWSIIYGVDGITAISISILMFYIKHLLVQRNEYYRPSQGMHAVFAH
jgi:hypothetical protein